ncbi:MAG: hypothetical protein BMS9Abin20_0260 [Acidimicrobiia bacterium]|nr:MAG: hypothetical protein BMS9Abin20_0260 [Acidimicrobiia bacterium]
MQVYLSRVKTVRRHLSVLGVLVAALAVVAMPVQAASPTCADRFPEVAWAEISTGDVAVYAAGVPVAMADRFDREIGLVSGWIAEDIGRFEATVCLVDYELRSIGDEFESGSRHFQAHQDLQERFVLLSTQRPAFIGPAAAFALAHQALWQNNGNAAFPEPIASVIAHWYRARILGRLEYYHRDVMVENFFDTDSVIDWAASSQEPVQDWIPENNFRAIGDFVDFAVSEHGTDVLLETDPAVWSEIEGEWRVALRADLTGRTTATTDWIVGVAIAIGIMVAAGVAVTLGLISKYRRKRRTPTASPTPGFFSDG